MPWPERRSRRSTLCTLLVASVLVCAGKPAPADAGRRWGEVLSPAGGETLRAGQWVIVRWSALPAEVEEFELLLSIDDGASFALRLTEQLDPSLGSYWWLVPNLPSRRARLQLRVGIGHREIEGPLGGAFEIVADLSRPVTAAHWRDGELWATERPQPPSPFQPLDTSLGLPQLQSGKELAAFFTENRGACLPDWSDRTAGLDLSFLCPSGGRPAYDRRPRELPLRR
ncbi:MAG TPA: hypothetical protein P5234_11335 [Thermoanaerobaculaceae bacterium]|nr:hypothetical protein [Thermoanaerobaculaceae bacterium]HRS16823.1 hypothetical protein [Thermoanaerobaculaceae bacterium]